jgi:hypothetical protein
VGALVALSTRSMAYSIHSQPTVLHHSSGISVSNCLEKPLLQTVEPLGDGVASPHTTVDVRYIQELQPTHGLDYDCNASNRSVERQAGLNLRSLNPPFS